MTTIGILGTGRMAVRLAVEFAKLAKLGRPPVAPNNLLLPANQSRNSKNGALG